MAKSPGNLQGPTEGMKLLDLGAVFGGVTIQSSRWVVAVCRRHSGALVVGCRRVDASEEGAASIPFVRGVVKQARQWFPAVAVHQWAVGLEEADPDEPQTSEVGATYRRSAAPGAFEPSSERQELPPRRRAVSLSAMLPYIVGASVFMLLPQLLTAGLFALLGLSVPLFSGTFQITTALVTLGMTLGYFRLIRRMPEVRSVFQYNTAALKVLVAHEAGEALSVEAARRQSPLHPWSSANFIAAAIAISPAVFYLVGRPLEHLGGSGLVAHGAFVALKVAALPAVISVVYEIQQLAVRLFRAGRLRAFWPALCVVQRVVILTPDDAQLEVAIRAMREILKLEASVVSTGERPA